MGTLDGLKVLDLSRILSGPWSAQLLADLGADVIKVEQPERGDDTRGWGPPFAEAPTQSTDEGSSNREAAYFLCANRGKRSITLDFKHEDGLAEVRRLARDCDVLIENFKAGALTRMGLGYDTLAQENPGLVYCSITGFGHTGPYRDKPGYDFLVQAMGGLMSVTGESDDQPGGGPQKIGVALSDILTGLYASTAVLAALRERDKSGKGQHIDLALLDVTTACLANQASNYLIGGVVPERLGNAHPNIVPYQSFSTSDGHMILAVGNDQQFARFATVLERPELGEDPRFATNAARVEHRRELLAIIEPLLKTRPSAEWLQRFADVNVPAGPLNTIDQVFSDPQVLARDMVVPMTHESLGELALVGNPIKLSRTPITYQRPPPTLGEHNPRDPSTRTSWLDTSTES